MSHQPEISPESRARRDHAAWLEDYGRWRSEHREALELLAKLETGILEQPNRLRWPYQPWEEGSPAADWGIAATWAREAIGHRFQISGIISSVRMVIRQAAKCQQASHNSILEYFPRLHFAILKGRSHSRFPLLPVRWMDFASGPFRMTFPIEVKLPMSLED